MTDQLHHRIRASRHRFHPSAVSPATHAYGVIGQCVRGNAKAWIGSIYDVGPGDVVVIPESMPHYMNSTSELEICGVSLCVACLAGPAGDALRGVFHAIREGRSAVLRAPSARIGEVLDQLVEEQPDGTDATELAIDGLLAQLAAELLRASTPATLQEPPMQPLVAEAIAHIEKHASKSISLTDVAAAVGRTPAHVAATMKSETGRTVGDWIADYRMASARQLLLRTSDAIDVVAERVGYASASHFHRVFRARHGIAPGRWRSLHRG